MKCSRLRRVGRAVALICPLLIIACDSAQSPVTTAARNSGAADSGKAPVPQSATDQEQPSAALDDHQRMLQLLARIAADAAEDNPYLGDAEVRRLQAEFRRRRPGDLPEELRIRTALGFEQLRLGRTDQAIEHLQESVRLITQGLVPSTEQSAETIVLMAALAWLRKAEVENCLDSDSAETCLFPVPANGLHPRPEAARQAMQYLQMLLSRRPQNRTAQWLLNIAAMTVGEYPDGIPQPFRIPVNGFDGTAPLARFENIAADLGVDVVSLSGGLIAEDFNNDGWIDLMVSDCHPAGQLRLFQNHGHGGFRDITDEAGLKGITGGLNLIQADYNNDDLIDVLVLRGAWLQDSGRQPNSLLQNCGSEGFRDVSFAAGIAVNSREWPNAASQTAAWADYDLDGDLDLCVGNEQSSLQLFQNDGDGHFSDTAALAGLKVNHFVKGVVWGDYDHDGDPDLYVSCLDAPNLLFRNNGNGTFADVGRECKVDKPDRGFACWFWDYDNDGALDLFASSYAAAAEDIARDYLGEATSAERLHLYRGDGDGGFADVTAATGLHRVIQPMGANFGDLDHDGFLDFYLGTGDIPYQALMPNLMFYNQRGAGFSDVTALTGTGHLQKGHGVAFADFDQDGDQDVAIQLGGAFAGDAFQNALFRNPGSGNHWLTIQLEGDTSNRDAIGARIRLTIREGDEQRFIYRHVNSGGTFGANSLRQQIGIGAATMVEELQIEWPNSARSVQTFSNIAADQIIRITEGDETITAVSLTRPATQAPDAE